MKNKKSIVLVVLIAAAMLAVILAGFIKDNDLLPPATGVPAEDPATGNTEGSNPPSDAQMGSDDAIYNPLVEGKTAVAAGYEFTVLSAEVSKSPKDFEIDSLFDAVADGNGVLTNGYSYVFITYSVEDVREDRPKSERITAANNMAAVLDGEKYIKGYEVAGMEDPPNPGDSKNSYELTHLLKDGKKVTVTVAYAVEDQYLNKDIRLFCSPYGNGRTTILEDGTIFAQGRDIAMILVSDLFEEGTK